MRPLLPIVLALLLGGCTQPISTPAPDDAAAAPPTASASVSPSAPASVPGIVAAKPIETATTVEQPRETSAGKSSSRLALDGEGLRIFDAMTGSSRLIAFGTPTADAMRMLEAMQGGRSSDQGENLDCRATYATWPDGLTAWFARGDFAGWSVASTGSTLATASGIKIGSTRRELESAYDARVARSTLGVEFTAGGLAGLLASTAADARVTNLWAGTTCIAR